MAFEVFILMLTGRPSIYGSWHTVWSTDVSAIREGCGLRAFYINHFTYGMVGTCRVLG